MTQEKQVTKQQWQEMKLIAHPTISRGQIREDEAGDQWEWKASGARITIELFSKAQPPIASRLSQQFPKSPTLVLRQQAAIRNAWSDAIASLAN
jgi:hypothetical protein